MTWILALGASAQSCPSMQGQWNCYYKKDRSQTWPMTIVDLTQPGGPLTLQVASFMDGNQPAVYVADGSEQKAPARLGNGSMRSSPHKNKCGGLKTDFAVITKGVDSKIEQYLYPEGGGIVRIFRKTVPLDPDITEVSCKPVIKPKTSESNRPPE